MLYVRASLLLILIGVTGVASAVDLDLSMTTTVDYDDNIFRTNQDKKDDVSFRFGPTIRFRDETSKLSYRVSYNPVYEKFVSWTDADELSHFANGALEYQLSDRTLLSLSENFRFAQSLNRGPLIVQQDASGNDIDFVPNAEVQRDDIYLNSASASVFHNFTAHTQGEFTVSHKFFDSERRNSSTNNALSGFANVVHSLSARDQLGLGGGVTWQRFGDVRGQPQSDTFIFRLIGSWIHNFGQDTELTLRVGPAVIYTDQDSESPTTDDLYPHMAVPGSNSISIASAYSALGLEVPADVKYVDGAPIDKSDLIGGDSVLIPEDTTCLMGMLGVLTVFDRSNCSFNVVVNSDDYNALATSIATSMTSLGFLTSDGGGTDTRVTVFGEVGISHHWFSELSSSASYSRSDAGAVSLGSSSISDRVTVETHWTPTRRWELQVRGDWLRRKSANDITNTYLVIEGTNFGLGNEGVRSLGLATATTNDSVDTEYWRVIGRAAYRTSRRSTVSLRASYQDQDTRRGATRGRSTFENVIVMLGFRYDLDPFHF